MEELQGETAGGPVPGVGGAAASGPLRKQHTYSGGAPQENIGGAPAGGRREMPLRMEKSFASFAGYHQHDDLRSPKSQTAPPPSYQQASHNSNGHS